MPGAGGDEGREGRPQGGGAGHVGHQGVVSVLLGHHNILLGPVACPYLGPPLKTEPSHNEEEQENAGDGGNDDIDNIDAGVHLVHDGLFCRLIALLEIKYLIEKLHPFQSFSFTFDILLVSSDCEACCRILTAVASCCRLSTAEPASPSIA